MKKAVVIEQRLIGATSYRNEDAAWLREELTVLIRSSVKSREEIAEQISALVGTRVTKRALDSYTADSAEQNRWPAQYDIALCEVLGDFSLLASRVARAGFRMIGPEEERLIEIGRAFLSRAAAAKLLREASK